MAVKAPPPPPPPIATWTGFYLGVNGGRGWGTTRHTDDFGVTSGNFSTNGGVAGGTYGFNWQVNRFVIGFEGDFDWADIKGTFTSPLLCSINGGTTCFTTLRSLGTDRLRVGYDVNGWLLYGTAGVGYGEVKSGQNPCGLTAFGGFSCNTNWRTGWVAGGGVEKMFAPHWSAKLNICTTISAPASATHRRSSAAPSTCARSSAATWWRGHQLQIRLGWTGGREVLTAKNAVWRKPRLGRGFCVWGGTF